MQRARGRNEVSTTRAQLVRQRVVTGDGEAKPSRARPRRALRAMVKNLDSILSESH